MVIATLTLLIVTLDLPRSLHKTVHVNLVERAAEDPLLSQKLVDARLGLALGMEEEDDTEKMGGRGNFGQKACARPREVASPSEIEGLAAAIMASKGGLPRNSGT